MEVEVESVPNEEEPSLVNLKWVCVSFVVEMVVAVSAVEAVLGDEGAAVGVWKRAHELDGALVLRNVSVGDEMRSGSDAERKLWLEREFLLGTEVGCGESAAILCGGVEGHAAAAEIGSWERFGVCWFESCGGEESEKESHGWECH